MSMSEARLQVVFGDLRRAVDDVILKHQVTIEELFAAIGWLQRAADAGELQQAGILFFKTAQQGTEGAPYAHPEKDGASHWEMEGPAYVPGAPLPGAVLDVWQIDANRVYSGIMTGDFGPMDIPNDSTGIPTHNLRAKVVADREGRYEFRTVMPGQETLGFRQDDSPLTALTRALELPGLRPLHIHAIVSADGVLPLTTQIYFDGDPLVAGTIEGPIPASAVRNTERHDDLADHRARGLTVPYRTLTQDYVLRPVPATAPAPAPARAARGGAR
ncbi:dioxygenase family protein [Streptomyces mayteni]